MQTGEVLGNYRVVSRIGAGGMGEVWLAEHQLLGSHVAIKVLLPEMSSQKKIVERFFAEARAATRVQDPGIVNVLDFGWRGDTAYIVMEHLVGESLASRLEAGRLAPRQALRITLQCAMAMAAAHARGIVHRDLKPDNIFLVRDPLLPGGERIKILDFGIAKLLDDANVLRTQTGVILGTPAFMAPEQCHGGDIDHRADIYALGVVMFDMLCGRLPFGAKSAAEMLVNHISANPPVPSSVVSELTPDIDRLVLRCLEKDRERRFASMTELARAAAAVAGDAVAIMTQPAMRAPVLDHPTPTEGERMPTPATVDGKPRGVDVAPTVPSEQTVQRSRRRVLLVAGVLVLATAATFDVTRLQPSSSSPSTPAPVASAPIIDARPADAAFVDAPSIDAAVPPDAAVPDAAVPPDAGPKKRRHHASSSSSPDGNAYEGR